MNSKKQLKIFPNETEVSNAIESAGFECVQQLAFGRYNIDVAIPGLRIAVEVLSTKWHSRDRAHVLNRTKHILDNEWSVLFLCVYKRGIGRGPAFSYAAPAISDIAQQAVIHINEMSGYPTRSGKYRMIGCYGDRIASPRGYLDGLPVV